MSLCASASHLALGRGRRLWGPAKSGPSQQACAAVFSTRHPNLDHVHNVVQLHAGFLHAFRLTHTIQIRGFIPSASDDLHYRIFRIFLLVISVYSSWYYYILALYAFPLNFTVYFSCLMLTPGFHLASPAASLAFRTEKTDVADVVACPPLQGPPRPTRRLYATRVPPRPTPSRPVLPPPSPPSPSSPPSIQPKRPRLGAGPQHTRSGTRRRLRARQRRRARTASPRAGEALEPPRLLRRDQPSCPWPGRLGP